MKAIYLLFTFVAFVTCVPSPTITVPDAFAAFFRGEPSPIVPHVTMFKTIRVQSAQMAETSLFADEDGECLRRALCALGTSEKEWPRLSLGRGLQHLNSIFRDMINDVSAVDINSREHFPHIHQAVASHAVGVSIKDPYLCDTLFQCATPSIELLTDGVLGGDRETEVAGSVDWFHARQGRATCSASGKLCPGISIGCALCGIFSPGTCGDQCIMAGLYCGVSSFACKADKTKLKTIPK